MPAEQQPAEALRVVQGTVGGGRSVRGTAEEQIVVGQAEELQTAVARVSVGQLGIAAVAGSAEQSTEAARGRMC